MKVLVAQSCLTLCSLMDCGLPGSSVHGISQARILEYAAIPFLAQELNCVLHCRQILYCPSHQRSPLSDYRTGICHSTGVNDLTLTSVSECSPGALDHHGCGIRETM